MPRNKKQQPETQQQSDARTSYEFKSLDDGTVEVLLYDQIGADWWTGEGVTAKAFANELKQYKGKTLNVRINSPGGNIVDGMAIYNALQRHNGAVNVFIDGLAASMASVIAMAGKTVTMSDGSLMMIHNPQSYARGDEHEMRKMADVLSKHKANLIGAYAKKTGKESEELSTLMDEETWMTADEAYEMGFVDAVNEQEPAMALWSSDELAKAKCFSVPAQFKARFDSLSRQKEPEMAEEKTPQGDAGTPTEQPKPERVAATVEQLSALAGADDAWIVAQLKAKATIDEAKDSLLAKLHTDATNAKKQAQEAAVPKAEGVEPITGAKRIGEQPTEHPKYGANPKAYYIAELQKAVKAGMPSDKASQFVFNANPGLEDALAN